MQIVTLGIFLPLTLVLMAVSFSDKLRSRALACKPLREMEKRLMVGGRAYWLLFVLIMVAGALTRCWRFLELPRGVNQDGLMAAVEAYCLAHGGTDQFGTSWPTYFEAWGFAQMSTLYSLLMIPFVKLMGLSKLTLRLPMLLVSLSMLPVIWDFARRIRGRNFALLALFVAAVNPWHVMQSRWALEANLLAHVLLLACYLLYVGRKRRVALYLSMVFFGLAPYAYGLACFSVPVILLCMAVYYAVRKKAGIPDILVCVLIFVLVSGPYFATMVINALQLDTVQLGPVTLPYFELSQRTNDMAFFQLNPYSSMLRNLLQHLSAYLYGGYDAIYNVIPWAHTMYLFMPPVILYGIYRMWRNRRLLVLGGEDSSERDGMMLTQVWLLAAVVNGMCVGAVVNRNNVIYYPMIIACAYGLYLMGTRLRTALALVLAMLVVSFAGMNVTYFTDESYQEAVAAEFHNGLVEALEDTWDWDYDEVYISVTGTVTSQKRAEAAVMFAHDIDYAGRSEQVDLLNANGEMTGWYFTERYKLVNMEEFEPDPMACAVYIITQKEKAYFNEADYLLTDYGNYAAAYPRYWAE